MIPAPPPPSWTGTDIRAASEIIAAEDRYTLDVSTRALRLTPRGELRAGGVALALEEAGLRAVLMHYRLLYSAIRRECERGFAPDGLKARLP